MALKRYAFVLPLVANISSCPVREILDDFHCFHRHRILSLYLDLDLSLRPNALYVYLKVLDSIHSDKRFLEVFVRRISVIRFSYSTCNACDGCPLRNFDPLRFFKELQSWELCDTNPNLGYNLTIQFGTEVRFSIRSTVLALTFTQPAISTLELRRLPCRTRLRSNFVKTPAWSIRPR